MKRSMAGEIVATGEHDARLRPKCLYGGGDVDAPHHYGAGHGG
jgi:hypothetical protein